MAVEYKLRGDASQLKKELQGVTAKEKRLEQQTIRTKQGFDRLNISALKNENALRKTKLATQKITAAELKFATSATVATTSMNRQRQAANRMRRSTTGLAASVGALRNQILLVTFAFAGVVAAMNKVVNMGSDLNEAQNLVRKTFGDSSVEVELFASKAAGAIGQTRGEALKLLGDLGSITKGFGFTTAAAANFSQTALQLASDIGSLKNATTDEVLNAFRSAIVGQSEPMLRFGSDVRVATLEQIALEEGIINTKRALTNQEKAVAALVQVFRTNKDAIDDFAETQNQFATASKITGAKVRQLIEDLGTKLLPAAATAAVGITILVDNIDLLKAALKEEFKLEFIFPKIANVLGKFGQFKEFLKEQGQTFGLVEPDESFLASAAGIGFAKDIEEKTKSSLDELLALFKDAETKFSAAFDIGEGVEQAILNLGDGMRDVGDGLEESVLPPMEKIVGFTTDLEVAFFKVGLRLDTLSATKLPKASKEMEKAAAAAARMAASLAASVAFGDDLKSIFKSLFRQGIQIAFSQAFRVPGFAHGTNFAPGGAAIVGERGPELVNLPRGSQVIPNQVINNDNSVSFNMPNVKTFDRFTVENQLMPIIRDLKEEGDFL